MRYSYQKPCNHEDFSPVLYMKTLMIALFRTQYHVIFRIIFTHLMTKFSFVSNIVTSGVCREISATK